MAAYGTTGSAIGDGLSPAPVLPAPDGSGSVQIQDAQLLFLGDYSRQGHDLVIEHDGTAVLIEDYFAGGEAKLAAPNGAFLSADTVKLLAGPLAPGQYAQAAAADAPAATGLTRIGKVVSIEGSATATHSDGVSVPLKDGDPVYQGDVVQTGAGSKLGISFIDDSVFSMSADARMVLNELIFDPAKAADSSMVVNLVQGSFVFVTGKVAPSGDMKVETPVATMGIRGTTPKVLISSELGVTEFSILPDPDSGKIGTYVLLDKETGEILGTVESVGDKWVITSLSGEAVKVAKSGLDLLEDEIAMADIRAAVSSALGDRTMLEGSGSSYYQIAYNSSSAAGGQGSTGGDNSGGTGGDGGVIVDPTPGKDDAPIANADAVTTGEEDDATSGDLAALTGNVFSDNGSGADYDPDGFGITLISVNGTPLASWGGDLPSGATLAMTATGGFTYRPNNAFETIGLGETATDIFTYTIRDPGGFTGTGTVTVTITGRNDQPLIEASSVLQDVDVVEQAGVTGSDDPLSAGGKIDFSDIDTTDLHSVPIPTFVSAVWNAGVDPTTDPGTLTIHPVDQVANSADWSYSIADNAVDFLGVGETLTITYTVTVMDDSGAGTGDTDGNETATSVPRQIVVIITGTNDAPEITAGPVTIQIAESSEEGGVGGGFSGDAVTGTLAFTDVDVTDTGFGYEVVSVTETPEGGALGHPTLNNSQLKALLSLAGSSDEGTAATDGEIVWTFTGSEQQFDYLAAGESVTLVYTVQVRDEHGVASNQQTITVKIVGASDGDENDAPVISIETGDTATAGLTETNAGLSISDTLTVTEIDRTDTVELSITGMQVSNLSTDPSSARPSQAALEGMFSLTKDDVLSDTVATVEKFGWTFDSGSTNFDYLAAGEKLVLVYTIEADDGIDTDTQAVTVTITGTNDAPVITSTAGGGALDEAVAQTGQPGPPLATDGTIAFTDVDVSENAHVATVTVAATGATDGLALNNAGLLALFDTTVNQTGATGIDGSVDWSFAAQDQAFDYLADGEVVTLTYRVTITDAEGATVAQDVTITITGSNDQPVITGSSVLVDTITEQPATTGSLTPMTADGTIVFSDVDTTDLHSVVTPVFVSAEWSGGADPTSDPGSLVIGTVNQVTNSATWTYTVADGALDYLAAGETLTITYNVAVRDDSATGNNTSTVQQIVVTITGSNDKPVIEAIAQTDLDEQTGTGALTTSIAVAFADVDLGDTGHTASVTEVSVTGEDGGLALNEAQLLALFTPGTVTKVAGSASGSLTLDFSAAAAAFDYLAENETVILTYTVAVNDGDGGTGIRTFVVEISGTNDAPAISLVADDSAAETVIEGDAGLMTSGTLTVVDVDLSDAVTASVDDVVADGTTAGLVPDTAALTAMLTLTQGSIDADSGTTGNLAWSFDSGSETFDYLADGEELTLAYTVTVTDGSGVTGTQTVTVTVTGTNDQPMITAAAGEDDGEITEGLGTQSDSGTLDFTDADLTDTPSPDAALDTVTALAADGVTEFSLTTEQTDALQAAFTVALGSGSANDGTVDWSFNLDGVDLSYLGEGETVTAVFTVTLDDGNGGTASKDVTVVINGVNGGDRDDMLTGTPGPDVLLGGLGADILYGLEDEDYLEGGDGDDTLHGGDGDDFLVGGKGVDTYHGGGAGQGQWDMISFADETGAAGVVVDLEAGTATDTYGNAETLTGIEDIEGSANGDTLAGNELDNFFRGGGGADSYDGRDGFDQVSFDGEQGGQGAVVDLSAGTGTDTWGNVEQFVGIEMLRGSQYDDTFTGDANDNAFRGMAGNDTIDGGDGWDTVRYDRDANRGGSGGVTVDLAAGTATDGFGDSDSLSNIEGVVGTETRDTLTGDDNDNDLIGRGGDDTLSGGGGNDYLDGGAGDDMLVGGAGDDYLIGGEGADEYVGGDGPDEYDAISFRYETGGAGVVVNLAAGSATDTYGNVETLTGIEEVDGSANDDELVGNADENYFRGFDGADSYDGGAGGYDQVSFDNEDGGVGVVVDLSTGLGTDTWGNEETFTGIEVLRGSQYADEFTGDEFDNVFLGLAGNDVIDGGLGEDMVRYDRDVNRGGFGGATVDLAAGTAEDGFGDSDTLTGIEHARGTETADSLTGNDLYNRLEGLGGADMLFGGLGDDELFGGDGSDQLTGGAGADTFMFMAGESGVDDILDFGTEEDSIALYGFDEITTVISLVDNGAGGSNLVVNSQVVASLDGISHTTDFTVDYNADHHVITMMSLV